MPSAALLGGGAVGPTARRRFDAPTLLRRELHPTFHRELWPTTLLGHDRYGHPVVYERLSDLQLDRVLREFTVDEVLALRMQAYDALQHVCAARSTRAGKPRVYKCVFLVDVSGASLSLLRPQARALMAAQARKVLCARLAMASSLLIPSSLGTADHP